MCFGPCRFCLQIGFGCSGFSVGFCFSGWSVTPVVRRFGFASFVASVACQLSPAFPGCPVLAPVVKSSHRWGLAFPIYRGKPGFRRNPVCFVGDSWAFAGIAWPNKSVKGTRRPLAVLKFGFLSRFGASFGFRWRRAPYRNVRRSEAKKVGLGLPSSVSVATGSFLVWPRCCFGCHWLRRGTTPSAAVLRVVCLAGRLSFCGTRWTV